MFDPREILEEFADAAALGSSTWDDRLGYLRPDRAEYFKERRAARRAAGLPVTSAREEALLAVRAAWRELRSARLRATDCGMR